MSISSSTARTNLFPLTKQVNEDQKAILITSSYGNVLLVSEPEWENMLEMQHLLSTPANRDWLLKSIEQADRGETRKLTLPITVNSALHGSKFKAKSRK
jgi:antitoxin YefM